MKRQYLKSDRNFEKDQLEIEVLKTRNEAITDEQEEGGKSWEKKGVVGKESN